MIAFGIVFGGRFGSGLGVVVFDFAFLFGAVGSPPWLLCFLPFVVCVFAFWPFLNKFTLSFSL